VRLMLREQRRGVFVTTSNFTSKARDHVKRSPKRIVLIDGPELARLMVRIRAQYETKRIDEDYFAAETS